MDRTDEARLGAGVPECRPQVAHRPRQAVIADDHVVPHPVGQLLAGDHVAGVLHQQLQNPEAPLTEVDSLLATVKRLKAAGGSLRISGLNETVQEVFEISGFSTILAVFATEAEALQGF